MDIVLRTNLENPALVLRGFRVFADGSAFVTTIAVVSRWIVAEREFHCEMAPLIAFLSQLADLDATLKGSAVLRPDYERDFLVFKGNGRGGLVVSGALSEQSDLDQGVSFAFETDQTCVRPFIEALRAAIS